MLSWRLALRRGTRSRTQLRDETATVDYTSGAFGFGTDTIKLTFGDNSCSERPTTALRLVDGASVGL